MGRVHGDSLQLSSGETRSDMFKSLAIVCLAAAAVAEPDAKAEADAALLYGGYGYGIGLGYAGLGYGYAGLRHYGYGSTLYLLHNICSFLLCITIRIIRDKFSIVICIGLLGDLHWGRVIRVASIYLLSFCVSIPISLGSIGINVCICLFCIRRFNIGIGLLSIGWLNIGICLVSLSVSSSIISLWLSFKRRDVNQWGRWSFPGNSALLESLNLSLKNPAILASPIPLPLKISNLVIHPDLAHIAGISVSRGIAPRYVPVIARHGIVYPAQSLANRGVHSWGSILPTANTPGNHTSLYIGVRVVLDLGRWRRNEVRILAANIQKARALAVFRCQASEPISDVNKTSTVCDDGAVVALVVRYTLIAIFFSVVLTIFKLIIYLNTCLIFKTIIHSGNIIIWEIGFTNFGNFICRSFCNIRCILFLIIIFLIFFTCTVICICLIFGQIVIFTPHTISKVRNMNRFISGIYIFIFTIPVSFSYFFAVVYFF